LLGDLVASLVSGVLCARLLLLFEDGFVLALPFELLLGLEELVPTDGHNAALDELRGWLDRLQLGQRLPRTSSTRPSLRRTLHRATLRRAIPMSLLKEELIIFIISLPLLSRGILLISFCLVVQKTGARRRSWRQFFHRLADSLALDALV